MTMFDKEIITELKKHKLFEAYWNDEMEAYSLGTISLQYVPTEVNGYFKEIKQIELPYVGDINELKNTIAILSLVYTSSEDYFNTDDAMEITKCNGAVSAINAKVEVFDKGEKLLFPRLIYKFRLWSGKPENVESDTTTIKLLIEAI